MKVIIAHCGFKGNHSYWGQASRSVLTSPIITDSIRTIRRLITERRIYYGETG